MVIDGATFAQFCELAFFDKMLALSNKKYTFVLVSGFLSVVFSQFSSILFRRSLFN